jgi:hypothetical protein
MIEIRTYHLKPGTRDTFHQLVVNESLPLLKKWKISVIAYGPSLHDEISYFLIRSFENLEDRQTREAAIYSSDDWLKGPREVIMALIENYSTIVVPQESFKEWMDTIKKNGL